ncbi:MAG: hypothetical protein HY689_04670 [Chloroflexi bacterium]|nr:hypothetical protein [Chloroflexota bacterium]
MTAEQERMFTAERRADGSVVITFRPPRVELSGEAVSHVLASQKELLLAARSLLDSAIEWTERGGRSTRRSRVDIRVE